MQNNNERNYLKDNEIAKEAIQKENEFLKNEVIGKGAQNDDQPLQNDQTQIEKSLED